MSDHITLMGSEDVSRAGHRMQSAAEQMSRAASTIDDALFRHQRFLDEWIQRLEAVMQAKESSPAVTTRGWISRSLRNK